MPNVENDKYKNNAALSGLCDLFKSNLSILSTHKKGGLRREWQQYYKQKRFFHEKWEKHKKKQHNVNEVKHLSSSWRIPLSTAAQTGQRSSFLTPKLNNLLLEDFWGMHSYRLIIKEIL